MKLTKKQKEMKKSIDKDVKMVFCVNMDLKMQKGKAAAQVAHAAIKLYKQLLKSNNKLLDDWETTGTKKITLKIKNVKELHDIELKCEKLEVPCATIIDAGKTQIAAGSETIIALFGDSKTINQITGQLKLLS